MADDVALRKSGLETIDVEKARQMADDLVSSAISSLKQPISIPTTKGINLTEAETQTRRARDSRDVTNRAIDTETDRANIAAGKHQEALTREGSASADKIMADQARVQQEADLSKYYARLLGVSEDPDADIALLSQQIRQIRPTAEAKLRRVQEMQSVGFLDNPLEWVVNRIQLPAAIGDYNQEANLVNYLQSTIDNSIKNYQDISTHAPKGIPTITIASAKADADRIKALADKNKSIVDETLAKTNVTFAVQKLANDINIANATDSMSRIQLSNEQMKYQSLVNAINLADTHAKRLLEAARLIEKLEGTKGLDIVLANYDRIMGHPVGTNTRYTFEKFAEPQRQNMIAIGSGSIGAGPYEGMINYYRSRPGPGVSKETARLFAFIRDQADKVENSTEIQAIDKEHKSSFINKKLKDQLSLEINDASRNGNIFYEMTPAAMIASGAVPAGSQLAKVLEPFTKQSGNIPTNMVIEAINKEYPNPSDAGAVIADYYSRNIQLRNSVMNTSLAGISLPRNYKIKVGIFGEFSRFNLDLTRPEEATKYILGLRTNKMVKDVFPYGIGKFN